MKTQMLMILCICFSLFSNAQTNNNPVSADYSKNTVFIQAGPMPSLCYDRVLYKHNNFKFTTGLGISYFQFILSDFYFSTPVEANLIYGKNLHLEMGVGYIPVLAGNWNSITFKDKLNYNNFAYARLGLRYQQPQGNAPFLRLSFTPIIRIPFFEQQNESFFYLFPVWASAAVGITIKHKK